MKIFITKILSVVASKIKISLLISFRLGAQEEVTVSLYLKFSYIPASTEVPVHVSYIGNNQNQKVVKTKFKVPLALIYRPASVPKSAIHKITLDINKPIVNLEQLFGSETDSP